MRTDLSVRIRNQLCAAWKWFLSLLKQDWELSDYPVLVREHEIDPTYIGTRLKQHRYSASIVNWWVMSGGGETEQEARPDLEKHFAATKIEKAKSKKRLPRPGTHVPIDFAPRIRVSAHPELQEDFIRRVLNLDWAWLSDQSSLWDFHHADTNEALITKIKKSMASTSRTLSLREFPRFLNVLPRSEFLGSWRKIPIMLIDLSVVSHQQRWSSPRKPLVGINGQKVRGSRSGGGMRVNNELVKGWAKDVDTDDAQQRNKYVNEESLALP